MEKEVKTHIRQTTEMCADIVDVLSDAINEDALHTLVSVFLDISGLPAGAAMTTNTAWAIEHSIHLGSSGQAHHIFPADTLPPIVFRAMQTLQPEFAVTSGNSGLRYDYAFPLRVRGEALGAVSLQGTHSHLLDEQAISTLQCIADIAATAIVQTQQILQHRNLVNQLQNALTSRVVLEQAKGVLAERMKIDFSTAFAELRSIARSSQRPIHDVAEEIVHDSSRSTSPSLPTRVKTVA
jgi:hypothetical protein